MITVYDSIEHGLGLLPGKTDIRDYRISCSTAPEAFPEVYERPSVPVKNQGSFPTCAAHAGSEIVEMFNQDQTHVYTMMSTEFIYGNRPEGTYQGDGMYLRDVCNVLAKSGELTYLDLPGNSNVKAAMKAVNNLSERTLANAKVNRVSTYFTLSNETEMKHALMNYGPLLVNMSIYKSYSLDENYIYTPDYDTEVTGCHAVVIIGWNKDGWLTQNSWGVRWGNEGCFILPYDFKLNEVYGFTDDIYGDDIKKPYKTFIGKIFAIMVNYISNHFGKGKRK